MEEITLQVEADVNPTESEEKVKAAVENMFNGLALQVNKQRVGCTLLGEAKSRLALENFRAALRRDRVRAAARKFLHRNQRGNTVCFCLNKQVAWTGHVSFSQETGESPLGPIKVVIQSENLRDLIDWLAPRTA